MRNLTKSMLALLPLLSVANANAAVKQFEPDQKLTSIAALADQKFAIVNDAEQKAFFGSTNQNLGYDVYSAALIETNTAISFRLVTATGEGVDGCYYLQSVKPDGSDYTIWGGGYLNSQVVTGDCCFIMGLNGQNGQDGLNHAVWEIQENEGTFALKNKGTGLYLKTRDAAKYEEPTYFSFYTLKEYVSADPLAAQKADLEDAIAKGKMFNAFAYTETSFATLSDAVSAGETALVAEGATAESLTSAKTAIDDAIAALALKDGFVNLTADMFKTWDSATAPTTGSATGCAYELYVGSGLPYGDGSVGWLNFANLAEYDAFYVVAVEGTPRIMMNRDVNEGQWNADESASHLIEYPKDGWSSKYFSNEGQVYTVDLAQIVADKGFANLNAIKGANWQNVTVTGMYLYAAPVSELMAEAKALAADAEAVAVGKLIDAIAAAKASGDESNLQAAIDQFKLDNADLEKDETAKVATNGWKKFDGSAAGVCATQFAPAITTYDGRNAQLAESYEQTTATLGTIIYQDITGLANGTYKVGFYGNAFYTSGRGFDSPMADGAEDVAYVFANEKKEFITAKIATETSENNFRQFEVEVTEGAIKLGMGKEQAGTNWHTMQIYQLTWFTTAKAAYAADKEAMQAAIEAAKALKTATRTAGLEEFNAAIATAEAALASNKLNIAELEAEVAALKAAADAFKAANYVTYEGIAYVQDAETGKFMAAGHNWGTRAIVNEVGLDLTFAIVDGKVTIDSRVDNKGSHFLGSNLYMDSPAYNWALEKTETGYYITDGAQYLSVDAEDNLVMSDAPRQWNFISAEDVVAAKMAALAEASAKRPADATFLLQNPDFNRNDLRVSAWTVSEDCTNKNLNGGANGDSGYNCAESYHSTFTISQVVKNAPAGIYKMTAQGFFRQDDGSEEATPVFFIGDATGEIPAKTGEENSMTDAAISFSTGAYAIEPIEFNYSGEGDLVVGVKNETATHQWIIFDNFQLTYYGTGAVDCVELTEAITSAKDVLATLTSEAAKTFLETAIANAEAIVAAEEKTQETVDAAVVTLKESVTKAQAVDAYTFDKYAYYSWESLDGVVCEKGGVISYENGDGNRLNYAQAGYYTICLNGKKANMNDETPSANAGYMLVTLDQPVEAGDVIRITAFINKDAAGKKASAWYVFETGATLESAVYSDEANLNPAIEGGVITTTEVVVPAEAAGSKTIKISRGQGGTNLFVAKLQLLRLPAPLELTLESGKDIATELAAAVEGKEVSSITINLAEGGEYTVSNTLTTGVDFAINGNGATITMAEGMTGDFITLNGSEVAVNKPDGSDSGHKLISNVSISGIKVLGLQGALVKDAQKIYVETLTVTNSVVEIPAGGKNVFDFNGKGYAGTLLVNNSTIYAVSANTGFFVQYGSRPKNIDETWLQTFDIQNSTIVNIANGKNMCDLKQNGTAQNVYVVKNNIFVDCGKQNQVIVGLNKGQASATPSWDVDGNIFNWGGADVSAAEVEKAGKKAEEDIVKNSIAAVVTFADAAAGDFNATLALAEGVTAPETVGDPRWTVSTPSGIETIAAVAAQKDGKFLVNGKIVIVRNGRQYDVKGQMVK